MTASHQSLASGPRDLRAEGREGGSPREPVQLFRPIYLALPCPPMRALHMPSARLTPQVLDRLIQHDVQQLVVALEHPADCKQSKRGSAMAQCSMLSGRKSTFSPASKLDAHSLVDELGKVDGALLRVGHLVGGISRSPSHFDRGMASHMSSHT